jgi:hypothetical protein
MSVKTDPLGLRGRQVSVSRCSDDLNLSLKILMGNQSFYNNKGTMPRSLQFWVQTNFSLILIIPHWITRIVQLMFGHEINLPIDLVLGRPFQEKVYENAPDYVRDLGNVVEKVHISRPCRSTVVS